MVALAGVGIYACFKCGLLHYQEYKIDQMFDVDTVVLGDSAVGYALDAATFTQLSHRKTMSLALTGFNYGMPAAYVLLAQVLSKSRPKNILISLSAQTLAVAMYKLKRGQPIPGFIQAARRHPKLLFTVNGMYSWKVAKTLGLELFDEQFLLDGIQYAAGKRFVIPEEFYRYDYLEPGYDVIHPVKTNHMSMEPFPPHDYDVFFEKIVTLCRSYEVNCIYMHGPLMQEVVRQSHAMLQKLDAQIEHTGVKVIRQSPIEIPDEDLGNTINHIRPDVQLDYTRKIYDLVKDELR
jgi:hypothetical protein